MNYLKLEKVPWRVLNAERVELQGRGRAIVLGEGGVWVVATEGERV